MTDQGQVQRKASWLVAASLALSLPALVLLILVVINGELRLLGAAGVCSLLAMAASLSRRGPGVKDSRFEKNVERISLGVAGAVFALILLLLVASFSG